MKSCPQMFKFLLNKLKLFNKLLTKNVYLTRSKSLVMLKESLKNVVK